MRRLRLTIGYRGTRFAGWAVQSPRTTHGRPTVQTTLETALGQVVGHPVRATAAGRTDAGVHAEAQVVSFDTTSPIPAQGLMRAVGNHLPDDVWPVDAQEAPAGFDARRSARRRWYRYAIWQSRRRPHHQPPPMAWQGRCLVHDDHLDVPAMRQAAQALVGRFDAAALATQPAPGRSTHRTILIADWLQPTDSPLLVFEVCADAFLRGMVRTLVGSLLWVGRGRWTPDDLRAAIATTDRRAAGPSAPAHGLTLHRVDY